MELKWEFECPRHGPSSLIVETETGRVRVSSFRGMDLRDAIASHDLGDPCACTAAIKMYQRDEFRPLQQYSTEPSKSLWWRMGEVLWWRRLSALPSFRKWQRCRAGREIVPTRLPRHKDPESIVEEILRKTGLFQLRRVTGLQLSVDGLRWWPLQFGDAHACNGVAPTTSRDYVTVSVGSDFPSVVTPFHPRELKTCVWLAMTAEVLVLHAHLRFTQASRLNRVRLVAAAKQAQTLKLRVPPVDSFFVEPDPTPLAPGADVELDLVRFKLRLHASGLSAGETRLLLTQTTAALETIHKSRSRRPS